MESVLCKDNDIALALQSLFLQLQLSEIESIHELVGCAAHRVFIVCTKECKYIVKQLSPIMLSKTKELSYHQTSQVIAEKFKASGICISLAIAQNNSYVHLVNGHYYMAYLFETGTNIEHITCESCYEVGKQLALLHNIKIQIFGDEKIRIECYRKLSFLELVIILKQTHSLATLYTTLRNQSLVFKRYKKLYADVISHCDLTPHNILWENNSPMIIDWDAAGFINKTKDLLQTMRAWCMVDNHINQELLYSFFSGYLEHGTIEEGEIKDAYYSIFLEDFEYVEDSILFKKNIKMLLKTLNRECKKAKINIKGIRETIKKLN